MTFKPDWMGGPDCIPAPQVGQGSVWGGPLRQSQVPNRDQEILDELRAIRQHLEALKPKPSLILIGQQVVDEYERLTRNSGDG